MSEDRWYNPTIDSDSSLDADDEFECDCEHCLGLRDRPSEPEPPERTTSSSRSHPESHDLTETPSRLSLSVSMFPDQPSSVDSSFDSYLFG